MALEPRSEATSPRGGLDRERGQEAEVADHLLRERDHVRGVRVDTRRQRVIGHENDIGPLRSARADDVSLRSKSRSLPVESTTGLQFGIAAEGA